MARPSTKNIKKEELLIGAGYSLSNSFDLFDDGVILKEKGRLSRAYTLFQLSMEETGKVILLLDGFTLLSIHENNSGLFDKKTIDNYYKRLDNIFYDHSNKMRYIIEYELLSLNRFIENNSTNKEAGICKQRDDVQKDLKKLKTINELKNNSLYTSIENGKFMKPSIKIDSKILSSIEHKAFSKLMLTKTKSLRFLKERKLETGVDLEYLNNLKLYSVLKK